MSGGLEVIGLSKRFGSVAALNKVSLRVMPGEMVVVLGPSGSGKSTLFRCITGLATADEGEIFVAGRAMHKLTGRALAEARRDIGVVFQQFNLIRRRSAIDNVLAGRLGTAPLWRVLARRFGQPDEALAVEALAAVGLERQAHQRADTLSGGQQQRVAIARALAQRSRVLLADEPVASLDPDSAETVLELLQGLTRKEGLAVLCTLHQPHLADRFADRILTMRDGRLAEDARSPRPQGAYPGPPRSAAAADGV